MKISVIIPCLNEAGVIGNTLQRIISLKGDKEIIVVDGGSTDATRTEVSQFGNVQWLNSDKGRGIQMNAGARAASGECLLFLHADTMLPHTALENITQTMQHLQVAGGSFYLTFDKQHWVLDLCSRFSRINRALFTYGDQAMFIRTSCFQEIGGFQNWPILEDLEIQQRLRKKGQFRKLDIPVVTSARRFEKNGPLTQILKDIILVGAYKLGVSPFRIVRFYRNHSEISSE